MTITIIFAIIIILFGIFWYFGKKPRIFKNLHVNDLIPYFELLISRGYHHGFMAIRMEDDKRFMQFRKWIKSKGDVRVELGFPCSDWSVGLYDKVKSVLTHNGWKYETEKTGDFPTTEFLYVDIDLNPQKGIELTKLLLVEIFEKKPDNKLRVYFGNCSDDEENIGFK